MSDLIDLVSPFTDAGYEHKLCPHPVGAGGATFADNCVECLRAMYGQLHAESARLRAVLAELKALGRDVRRRFDTQQHPRLLLTYEGGLLLTALAAAKGGTVKPLLVGEANPYGADADMALYPLPENASGGRLARILGLSRTEYLRRFDRVNLCIGRWSLPAARDAAAMLAVADPNRSLVLLGAKVCLAFGLQFAPFTQHGRFYRLPHPSGLNRMWSEHGAIERARSLAAVFMSAGAA